MASLATPARAQGRVTTLDTVVVTASGLDQQIADTIPHTSVITEREIRNSGQSDLPGLLRGLAGFDFTQSGGHGTTSTVFMRGSEGRQMLLLLDGVPVGSATLGTAAVDQVPLDEIERIEVVRGNVSALYGSGAVGGVIQVFTRQGRGEPAPSASIEIGSHASRRASAGYRGAVGDTRFSLNLSHFRTDGQSAIDPALANNVNPDRDGYRNTGLSASVAHRLAADHELGLRLYHQQGRADYDNSGDFGASPSDLHVAETGLSNAVLNWNARFGEAWTSKLRLGSNFERADTRLNGASAGRFRTHGRQVEWRNDLSVASGQVLSATLGTQRQQVESDTAYGVRSRRSNSLALAYNGDHGAAQVQAALRHDRYSADIGHATTGLLGLGWRLTDEFKLIGTLSTAFNAPTFNQLYYPDYGNDQLKPERARSVELGAQYSSGRTLARLNWFRTRLRDLIDYDANFKPVNVAKARTQGIELTASTELDGWRLLANLTAQQPENAEGQTLQRRARHFGSVEAGRDFGAWRIRAQLTSSGSRPDLDYGPYPYVPVTLSSYTLLNLSGAWRLAPDLWLTARVTNATDERYSTVYSYPSPGREVHVGLAWQH